MLTAEVEPEAEVEAGGIAISADGGDDLFSVDLVAGHYGHAARGHVVVAHPYAVAVIDDDDVPGQA